MRNTHTVTVVASFLAAAGLLASVAPASAQGISISGPFEGEAKTLNAAGATFPAPLYQKWFDEYSKLTGVQVNYQPIGSGGGIMGIQGQTVDFGASDAPMTDEQLQAAKGGEILHIPTALGAIVPTYNVPDTADQLNFTGDTLAGIFLGDIQTWSDPRFSIVKAPGESAYPISTATWLLVYHDVNDRGRGVALTRLL